MTAPLAEFSDYEGLRRALNAVRENRRDISFELLDELTGAPRGYFSKTLGPKPAKRIGLQSLGWALGGLGVKCILVEDPKALARIKARLQARDRAHVASVHSGAVRVQLNRGFLRKIGRKGGKNSRKNLGKRARRKLAKQANIKRNEKLTARQRKESARRASAARWARYREQKQNLAQPTVAQITSAVGGEAV